ncbi:MAG: tetratricopeptide repeat protein, partial [Chloroflexi bacterium]|nr:tetratricopeptide repeat protein [Chloroflexota bacterium]
QSVGRYQFTHALIQETLAEELSLTRRVRLHARIAEALEQLYGDDTEAHAAELAHHFAQAEAMTGPEKLVRYSLQAGERALAAYAYEEAQGHFQRGLAGKGVSAGDQGPAPDAESAALLFGLGRTQVATFETHRLQEAVATLSRAFDYYAGAGDVERAVAVAEHPLQASAGRVSGAGPLIARALELVPPDSLQSARLLSRYGSIAGLEEGDYQKAQELFERSLQIAQREGQPGVELPTLVSAAEIDFYHKQYEETLSKAMRGVELASLVDDPLGEMLAHYWVALSGLMLGNVEGLSQHAEATLPPAERLRHHFYLARAYWGNELLAHARGDLQAARAFSERGLAISPREPRLLMDRALLEYETGESDQGELYLGRLVELMRSATPGPTIENTFAPLAIAYIAGIVGFSGELEMAKEIAETNLAYPVATPIVTEVNRICLALIAVYQDDRAAASAQHDALASQPNRGLTVIFGIQSDHVLGLLAQTMGNFDQAITHFEDALSICRSHGYRCMLAWTCCDYADALRERDGVGDRTMATALLDESLALSRELGMRPLMERVLSRREILGA